jgi:hypothetical protein
MHAALLSAAELWWGGGASTSFQALAGSAVTSTRSCARRPASEGASPCRETYIKAEAGESPNDRNDRAIRVAAAWYAARLPKMRIVVLTNDADNRRRALEAGLQAMTVQARTRAPAGPTACQCS